MQNIKDKVEDNFSVQLYDKIISEHGTSKRLFDGEKVRVMYFEGPSSEGNPGYCYFDPDAPMVTTVNTVNAIAQIAKHVSRETLLQVKQDEALMYVLVYNYRKAAMAALNNEEGFTNTMRFALANSVNELAANGIKLSARNNGTVYITINGTTKTITSGELLTRIKGNARRLTSNQVLTIRQALDLNDEIVALNKAECERIFAEVVANNGLDLVPDQKPAEDLKTKRYINTELLEEIISGRTTTSSRKNRN